VAAACRGGCATLLTEDLQHGSTLAGMNVLNPFA
jgi:predicted nucleic acid-binding protein